MKRGWLLKKAKDLKHTQNPRWTNSRGAHSRCPHRPLPKHDGKSGDVKRAVQARRPENLTELEAFSKKNGQKSPKNDLKVSRLP